MDTNTLQRPVILSQDEVYDQLMSAIEPELTSNQVPLLDQKYAGESEQDQQARMARYNAAFAAFDIALANYLAELNQQVTAYCRYIRKNAEKESATEEDSQLANIEKQFTL